MMTTGLLLTKKMAKLTFALGLTLLNGYGMEPAPTDEGVAPAAIQKPQLMIEDLNIMDNSYKEYILKYAEIHKLYAASIHKTSVFQRAEDPRIRVACYPYLEIHDPETHRKDLPFYDPKSLHMPLSLGAYAVSTYCAPWIQNKNTNGSREQGIKIHVSAKPETALKIAQLTLPILESLGVTYKVMFDLRQMRYIYYLTQYDNASLLIGTNQCTQAGKFIAIFPDNKDLATKVLKLIDEKFIEVGLCSEDFEKLLGDAQIGKSGGIFARFGKFHYRTPRKGRPGTSITVVNPLDQSIELSELEKQGFSYDPINGIPDERIYPWPDYMNNRLLYPANLFGDLAVHWTNPKNADQSITWENRPNRWEDLEICPKSNV